MASTTVYSYPCPYNSSSDTRDPKDPTRLKKMLQTAPRSSHAAPGCSWKSLQHDRNAVFRREEEPTLNEDRVYRDPRDDDQQQQQQQQQHAPWMSATVQGKIYLNPSPKHNAKSPGFSVCKQTACGGNAVYWDPSDPRLYDTVRALPMFLSEVPSTTSSQMSHDELYSQEINDYGKQSLTYEGITSGQETFYIDKSLAGPFPFPVFSSSAEVTGKLFVDPMWNVKPHYTRVPIIPNASMQRNPTIDGECLSEIRDTNAFRENILASQMAVRNQQKYSARYYHS